MCRLFTLHAVSLCPLCCKDALRERKLAVEARLEVEVKERDAAFGKLKVMYCSAHNTALLLLRLCDQPQPSVCNSLSR